MVVLTKILFLTVTGSWKLEVMEVTVNESFLICNALVVIHWKVKNVLWISIQGKWAGCRPNQVMVVNLVNGADLSVHIQGLFSRYHRTFSVRPTASIAVRYASLSYPQLCVRSDRLYPNLSSCLEWTCPIRALDIRLKPRSIEFNLAPFQIETEYEKRLL